MHQEKSKKIQHKVVIVVLLKNKLVTMDAILPILMELKDRYAEKIRISLVFPNKVTLDEVNKNFHINKAISTLQADSMFLRGQGRLSQIINTAKLIATILSAKSIIVKFSDNAFFKQRILLAAIKKLVSCVEILGVLGVPAKAFRPEAGNILRKSLTRGKADEDNALINLKTTDYVLSSMTASQISDVYRIQIPDEKLLYTGYYRGFPAWLKYIEKEKASYSVINGKEYFLYVLTTLGKRLANIDEPHIEELLIETLRILKKYNSRINTIFKPHPVTNMRRLREILEDVGYENYTVDYGHPMILSTKAKFVIANLFSTAMVDSYYAGCPIIEYCQYDPRMAVVLNDRSYGQELCDFFIRRDPAKLEEIVAGILGNEIVVSRKKQFIDENFPSMPSDFFEFWDQALSA